MLQTIYLILGIISLAPKKAKVVSILMLNLSILASIIFFVEAFYLELLMGSVC